MVKRELPRKFGLDPCSGFRETWVYRQRTDDGQQSTDACATTVALLTKSRRAERGFMPDCVLRKQFM